MAERLSEINNFKKVVNASIALMADTGNNRIFSPYSAASLATQLLGLNAPLMGSGNSPYSVISLALGLRNKAETFNEIFSLPLEEKRLILDEIYDMLAPTLLGEQENYIKLLAETRFRRLTRTAGDKLKFRKNCAKKLLCMKPFVRVFNTADADFAHIVHYGHPDDLLKECGFLKNMPAKLRREWGIGSYPIVNEITIDNLPARHRGLKKEIKGWIIFAANHTRELLESHTLRGRKIFQAARLGKILGAKIIGMGGLVASFAQGGRWLSDCLPDTGFTTGHAYTIGNILAIAKAAAERAGRDISASTIAIIGAAGSIGSGCAWLIARELPRRMVLIDLNSFGAQEKLEALRKYIHCLSPNTAAEMAFSLNRAREADIVIVATNSATSIIRPEHLKQNAIVIDDSFPKNISRALARRQPDTIFLEGGITKLPEEINIFCGRNMPDLMDVPITRTISCKETYSCFAETLTLASCGWAKNYGLGRADPKLAKDILRKARRAGFGPAPLQCFDEAIEEERFKK